MMRARRRGGRPTSLLRGGEPQKEKLLDQSDATPIGRCVPQPLDELRAHSAEDEIHRDVGSCEEVDRNGEKRSGSGGPKPDPERLQPADGIEAERRRKRPHDQGGLLQDERAILARRENPIGELHEDLHTAVGKDPVGRGPR